MSSLRSAIRAAVVLAILVAARPAPAQHFFEARGADSKYRYFDWNYTFANSGIVDLFYVGVPGSNEFNLGGGYGFQPGHGWTIAPLAYAVLGKESAQRGVKIALLVACDWGGWKLNSFLGHYASLAGDVESYQVLDTLDVTRVIRRRVDLGISSGFFHAGGSWNPQVGPVFKWNDRLGSWSVSYRFGPQRELRFGRILLLK